MEIVRYGNFRCDEKNTKKQIILKNTNNNSDSYLKILNNRHFGGYKKLPHYIVNRDGSILKILDDKCVSTLINSEVDKKIIVISLENLGWLKKNSITNSYYNYLGTIYNKEVYEQLWRGGRYWEPYNETQINSLTELCNSILTENKIPKNSVTHGLQFENVENFKGIVSYSNYNIYNTELNPSFNFFGFDKKLKEL